MDPLFKPCIQCGKEIGHLAVLTPKGPFCDDRCIARYVNLQSSTPLHVIKVDVQIDGKPVDAHWDGKQICITEVTTDPNSTSTVEFVAYREPPKKRNRRST